MQCGVACLAMICRHYGKRYSVEDLSQLCRASTEGVSLLSISESGEQIGFDSMFGRASIEQLINIAQPCILHWKQNHFVVLYRIKNGKKFYIADPGKGLITYSLEEFKKNWLSTISNGKERGIVLFLQPTSVFYDRIDEPLENKRTFSFLFGYIKQYKKYFGQIILGLFVGCILQLIFPFLTQSIVDVGITHKDVNFIWLVLLGQIMLTFSRAIIDFVRRWLLLHISMRINISLVSDFFIAVTYSIPYPDNLQVSAMIINTDDKVQIRAFVPYLYVNTIYEGMNANIEFEGYPSFDYGYTTTVVSSIDKEVYNVNGKNFFTVYMDIQHNNGIVLFPGMNGTANITVSKKSFLHKMLKL